LGAEGVGEKGGERGGLGLRRGKKEETSDSNIK